MLRLKIKLDIEIECLEWNRKLREIRKFRIFIQINVHRYKKYGILSYSKYSI